jgi:hypothetical protein
MMDELREKVAAIVGPVLNVMAADGYELFVADQILAIPEIAEGQQLRQQAGEFRSHDLKTFVRRQDDGSFSTNRRDPV